jgi:hypothetical protein
VVGLSVEELSESTVLSANLAHWWNSFLQSDPLDGLPQKRLVEHTLSCPLDGYRLTAQYDLLAIEPGKRALILDWKTSSRKPNREFLKNRMQTHVYRYLLVAAGASLNDNQPLKPDQVEMVYWFPEHPTQPVRFPYDEIQFASDRTYLTNLIAEIAGKVPDQFMLTPDEKKCMFCNFRSLCDRGEKAGDWNDMEYIPINEAPMQNDLNFEQIGEIEF